MGVESETLTRCPIQKLDDSIINKIAAGETIIQPANALKEMLENSIDAGSTHIEIIVKDGGLKLVKIIDNGSGIHLNDLPLLCERFATLKLETFDDLSHIATYGFRGEALASISHISRVSVVTKTRDSELAYKAFYMNGVLCAPNYKAGDSAAVSPQPIAGRDGTQITVEDLFYNTPLRLKSLNSKSNELSRILDVVGRYSVHCDGVSISCKKLDEPHLIISTRAGMLLKERIRSIFSSSIANELVTVTKAPETSLLGIKKMVASFTGPNYTNKKNMSPVFFINNRLVSCEPLRRALNVVFQIFLPRGNYPFLYLSLDLVPENLDVNMHPTKREVRFMHEEEVIKFISENVHDTLSSVDDSRSYKVQSTLPEFKLEKRLTEIQGHDTQSAKKPRLENKLVRVDSQQSKILAFLTVPVKKQYKARSESALVFMQEIESGLVEEYIVNASQNSIVGPDFDLSPTTGNDEVMSRNLPKRERVEINLDSILSLRQEVSESVHRELTNIFSSAVFVGIVLEEKRLCCFQYDTGLYMCDFASILCEFFYQVGLAEFANFGKVLLSNPIPLVDLIDSVRSTHSINLQPTETLVETICSMKEMFYEYFQIEIDTALSGGPYLVSLPLLVEGVIPSLSKLPYFIYKLGAAVDYSVERDCIHAILRQVAILYIPDSIPLGTTLDECADAEEKRTALHDLLDNVLFPQLNQRFLAVQNLEKDFVKVTDLPTLYRVFERC